MNRRERRVAARGDRRSGQGLSTTRLLAEAVELHRTGRLDGAKQLYLRVLDRDAANADALKLMGVAHYQAGDAATAIEWLSRAVAASPEVADAHANLGLALEAVGRSDDALAAMRRAYELDAEDAGILDNLGNVYSSRGAWAEAVACFDHALRLQPDYVEALNNKAIVLWRQGHIGDALELLAEAVARRPDYAVALCNIGKLLREADKPAAALDYFRRVIELQPGYGEAWNSMGLALLDLGEPQQALAAFEKAAELRPTEAGIRNNIGSALMALDRRSQAEGAFRQAWAMNPRFGEAACNIANVLVLEKRMLEAVEVLREALASQPDNLPLLQQMGKLTGALGLYEDARTAYDRATTLAPNDGGLRLQSATLLPVVPESSAQLADSRSRFLRALRGIVEQPFRLSDPINEVPDTSFYLAYHGLNDRPVQQTLAQVLLMAAPSLSWTAPHCQNYCAPSGRIRLGILSRHFYRHTISTLNLGLMEHLDRRRIELVVMRPPLPVDDMTSRIEAAADLAIELPMDLEKARRRVADERLDALFYPDIGMETFSYCLSFARLAPVQAVGWGHPNTTGVPNVDYFLSAEDIEPPNADEQYSERLIRLKHLPTYYHRPEPGFATGTHAAFGLPDRARLYVCPQSLFKFHPHFDEAIGALLRADPQGLFVLVSGVHETWTDALRRRFEGAFPDCADRVVFLPRMPTKSFLRLLQVADVLLDPPYFGGGNTAYEAFAMGTPIVTWPGPFMRGRVTLGCYRAMGIDDLIVDSAEGYVRLALRLSHDRDFHAAMSAKIKERSSVLYENQAVVTELEDFFVAAVHAAANGTKL